MTPTERNMIPFIQRSLVGKRWRHVEIRLEQQEARLLDEMLRLAHDDPDKLAEWTKNDKSLI